MAGFGDWLKHQLARRDMKQVEFASKVGASTGTVSNWINGDRIPSPASCERIAEALFLQVDEVLTRAGHRPVDIVIDPESPTARLMTLIEKVDWESDPMRLAKMEMDLRWMIERDRENKEE